MESMWCNFTKLSCDWKTHQWTILVSPKAWKNVLTEWSWQWFWSLFAICTLHFSSMRTVQRTPWNGQSCSTKFPHPEASMWQFCNTTLTCLRATVRDYGWFFNCLGARLWSNGFVKNQTWPVQLGPKYLLRRRCLLGAIGTPFASGRGACMALRIWGFLQQSMLALWTSIGTLQFAALHQELHDRSGHCAHQRKSFCKTWDPGGGFCSCQRSLWNWLLHLLSVAMQRTNRIPTHKCQCIYLLQTPS